MPVVSWSKEPPSCAALSEGPSAASTISLGRRAAIVRLNFSMWRASAAIVLASAAGCWRISSNMRDITAIIRDNPSMFRLLLLPALLLPVFGGEFPRSLSAYRGAAPVLDGKISPGEWDDATEFFGVKDWIPQFSPTTDAADLSLHGYVKHDGKRLYFAFVITDDVLYGIDTPRWLPDANPKAHELTREGFPWFGDEMELLINAANHWTGEESAAGDGSSWQMVCNLTKSRKGGVGIGGLLEGEPRRSEAAWNTYQRWILSGAQEAVAKVKPGRHVYIIDRTLHFHPCLDA